MRQEECGQITVFLGLMLISFFLILSICVEGIYIQMKKADFTEQQMLSGEHVQANFHKELLEQFHLFAIDGRYYTKMETSIKKHWEQNFDIPLDILQLSAVTKITDDEAIMKHQICEYMKYKQSIDLLKSLKKSFQGIEEDEKTESFKSKFETDLDEKESDSSVNLSKEETNIIDDPRKGLKEILSGGVLKLVMPENKTISTQAVSIVYGKEDHKKEKKIDFFSRKSVADFLETSGKESARNQLTSEGLSVIYMGTFLRNATGQKAEKGIQYEMEYLIAGKGSDKENLKSVVNRLMIVRLGLNYAHLLSSTKKQAEAYALAVQIANLTSTVPGVVEGLKQLIMAAWAYGESIIDLRSLLKGNKIAFVKNEENWQLSLSSLARLSAKEKNIENGITYKDYLQLLLLMQSDKKEKYRRMMDVIEQRIQEKQTDFLLSECVFSYQMTAGLKVPLLFYDTSYELKEKRVYVY